MLSCIQHQIGNSASFDYLLWFLSHFQTCWIHTLINTFSGSRSLYGVEFKKIHSLSKHIIYNLYHYDFFFQSVHFSLMIQKYLVRQLNGNEPRTDVLSLPDNYFPIYCFFLWDLLSSQVPDNTGNVNHMFCGVFFKFQIVFLEIVMRSGQMYVLTFLSLVWKIFFLFWKQNKKEFYGEQILLWKYWKSLTASFCDKCSKFRGTLFIYFFNVNIEYSSLFFNAQPIQGVQLCNNPGTNICKLVSS